MVEQFQELEINALLFILATVFPLLISALAWGLKREFKDIKLQIEELEENQEFLESELSSLRETVRIHDFAIMDKKK